MEMTMILKEMLKSDTALTPASGTPIFESIYKEITEGNVVRLDFSGMSVMTTAFLNACIGQLYNKFTSQQLNHSLKIVNISSDDLSLVKIVVERAKVYFHDKKGFEKRKDQFLDNG